MKVVVAVVEGIVGTCYHWGEEVFWWEGSGLEVELVEDAAEDSDVPEEGQVF